MVYNTTIVVGRATIKRDREGTNDNRDSHSGRLTRKCAKVRGSHKQCKYYNYGYRSSHTSR